jgi:3-hydroxyisobutyrate dehydrogenase-like beta-hydroxyacid dehydrogenase
MREGAVCIDMTSASGSTKQEIAHCAGKKNKRIGVIDAPVSGGVPGAKAGTLTIMVGCDETLYHENLPIFEAMGSKIVHTGELGSASNIKTLNQMLNAGNSAVACEVLCVAKKMGVDLNKLYDIVNDSSGGSFVFKNNTPRYVFTHDHEPGFRLDLMKKDVGLFIESAKQNQSFTPISDFVYQIYKATSNQGHGNKNTTYIFEWYEENQ